MGISWIYLINMGDLEMDIPTYQSWGMNIHNPMGWLVYGWCTGPVKWWCCWKNAMRFGGLPHGTKSIWNGVMISLVRRQVSAKWKICWTDLWFRGTFLSNESPNPDSRQNKNHWLATSNAMRQSDALSSTQGQSKSIEKYFFFPHRNIIHSHASGKWWTFQDTFRHLPWENRPGKPVKWMKWVPNNGRMRHWPHGQARCGNTVSKSSGAVGMLGCLVEGIFWDLMTSKL